MTPWRNGRRSVSSSGHAADSRGQEIQDGRCGCGVGRVVYLHECMAMMPFACTHYLTWDWNLGTLEIGACARVWSVGS